MVFVKSINGEPLMPCSNVIARLLLKQKKATVKTVTPFTIRLNYTTSEFNQPLTHGIDTGSDTIGSAVVIEKGDVIYVSEIQVRNDIADKMKQRSKYRRSRRNRKTRYREARWLNRKNSKRKDRFSPTMVSKINSHIKEINFVKSILPITELVIETGNFDPHALKNPIATLSFTTIRNDKMLYQRGVNYGFANTKAFVLHRDDYCCQNCKAKKVGLEVHHIVFRSNGGSDEPENLITLCKKCHNNVHDGTLTLKKSGKKKGTLKHATQMNSIRVQLLRLYPQAIETFGYITKEHRQLQGLPKEHYTDAVAIASKGRKIQFITDEIFYKKSVSVGDYQLRKGVRSQMIIPTGKLFGFRKFDKVLYDGKVYFIKGRKSTGYAILMDIYGKPINLKPIPKFTKMKRLQARKSILIYNKKMSDIRLHPLV